MSLKLRPLSYSLGAEVCDIDVSRKMSDEQMAAIHYDADGNGNGQPKS